MGSRHDEWGILPGVFLRRVQVAGLDVHGGFDWPGYSRVLHHLSKFAHVVAAIVSILLPNIQQLVQPSMVFGVLRPVVRRRVPEQLHDKGL